MGELDDASICKIGAPRLRARAIPFLEYKLVKVYVVNPLAESVATQCTYEEFACGMRAFDVHSTRLRAKSS